MATILIKNSATASAVPAAGSLTLGELALNTTDGKLFTKKGNGSVVEIGAGAGTYTLPLASTSQLGGVKIGSGVSIDANGFLSASGSGGGSVTSVTGSTGITVTSCATTPVVAIDSTVATLTGTQTLTNKVLTNPTINSACLTGSLYFNQSALRWAGVQRELITANSTVFDGLCGSVIEVQSSSAVTITIPTGLSSSWNASIVQTGTGQVTIVAGSGATVVGKNGLKTSGQYAVIGIFYSYNGVFIVTGDTSV